MTSHRLPLGGLLFGVDRDTAPLLEIEPGDEVVLETEDAFCGQIRRPGDRRDKNREPRSNPVNGPIAVRGAVPGDALRVEIRSIEPRLGCCATYLWPHASMLAELGEPPHHGTRICPIRDGWIEWSDQRRIRYAPLAGVVATAPASGALSTGVAHDGHGGNVDLLSVRPGATITLPVAVPGGLLVIGDCHAAQGAGELSGAALEMAATVTVRVGLAVGAAPPSPRIETAEAVGVVAVRPALDDAIAVAYGRLAVWLEQDHGLDRWEAYALLTQVGQLEIGYFRFGVVAAFIDRAHLPAAVGA